MLRKYRLAGCNMARVRTGKVNKNKAVQLDMPRPWTGNKPLFVRLTAAEIELLKQKKAQRKLHPVGCAGEGGLLDAA